MDALDHNPLRRACHVTNIGVTRSDDVTPGDWLSIAMSLDVLIAYKPCMSIYYKHTAMLIP